MSIPQLLSKLGRRVRGHFHLWVGRLWLLTGAREQARRQFQEVLQYRGTDFRAYLYLGRLALEEGNLRAAAREMDAARRASPEQFAKLKRSLLDSLRPGLHREGEDIDALVASSEAVSRQPEGTSVSWEDLECGGGPTLVDPAAGTYYWMVGCDQAASTSQETADEPASAVDSRTGTEDTAPRGWWHSSNGPSLSDDPGDFLADLSDMSIEDMSFEDASFEDASFEEGEELGETEDAGLPEEVTEEKAHEDFEDEPAWFAADEFDLTDLSEDLEEPVEEDAGLEPSWCEDGEDSSFLADEEPQFESPLEEFYDELERSESEGEAFEEAQVLGDFLDEAEQRSFRNLPPIRMSEVLHIDWIDLEARLARRRDDE